MDPSDSTRLTDWRITRGQSTGPMNSVRWSPRTHPGHAGIPSRDGGTHRYGSPGVKRPDMGIQEPGPLRCRCSDYPLAIRTESWAASYVAIPVRMRPYRTTESPVGVGAPTDMGVTPLSVPTGESRVPELTDDATTADRPIPGRPRSRSKHRRQTDTGTRRRRSGRGRDNAAQTRMATGCTTKPANASAWIP
jgi:hypothetical protein